ncbi:PAS domain S-box protein [Desulfopila aestuarii]|uniref:histidine kinase n=1 Tax=Desulfopila aestuarii DSM 18488 TaxID=1121416 RepID=A0A1M7Y6D7_9BACT|nr:PAS domain S-box protein [Desulfopila aestuarii]SHO48164.1 PAS domain S-box-containing protein [Desulfopila aestuarii DSM 18488]
MSWLFPAVLSTLIGCTLLSVAYGYLYYAYRKKFLALWFLAWAVHSLRYIFLLIIIANGNSPALSFASLSMIVISLYFLYTGTSEFIEEKISPIWQGAFVLVLAWTALAVFFNYSFLMLNIPLFGFFACVDIWVGYSFLRSDFSTGVGKRVVGITFIVWGLHQADYPFLRPVEWFAPFGYMIGTTCAIIIALGMLILFFERMRSELDFQKTRLRQMFDSASYGIALADPATGTVIDCNTVFAEMLERDMSEIIGTKQKDFHPVEEHEENFTHTFKQHLQEKSGETLVSKLVTASGKIIDVEIKATLVDLENKQFLQGFFTDISEKRKTELELENLQHLYRETEKVGKVGGWEVDIASLKIKWTEEVYRIHEVDSRTFQPTLETTITFYTPTSRSILEKAIQRAIEFDEPYDLELEIQTAQGNLRWVHTIGKVDRDQHKVVGFFQDITKRKIAEDALLESEITFRKLFEGSSDPILLIDGSGVFVECNQAALDLLKMTREQFLLLPPTKISPEFQPDGRRSDEAAQEMIALAYSKGRHRFDWTCVNAAGDEFIVEVSLMPVMIKGQNMLHTTWRDITERKQAEEDKLKLESQLQQAQKIESIGQLAGGVAHDFNNMLGVILGHTELALMEADPASPFVDDLEEIRSAAKRSADLTRQLLTFARKQTITPKVLDLNDTVTGMLKMLQRLIGENIQLIWNPGAHLWAVNIDPSQLDQILANLCVNARDAISGIGKITIQTRNCSFTESDKKAHPEAQQGDFVQLSVSDDGHGISKENLDQIFDPFFTTKDFGQGTGLGLSTVYGAVKQNRGFIEVTSEVGHGTTFHIYLPRKLTIVEPVEEIIVKPLRQGTETVLLVEDDQMFLKLIKTMLEKGGYAVLAASTIDGAISLAKEHPGPIHLLLSDLVMPEMNGKDLRDILQVIRPEMKVIFMSGYTADIIAQQGVLDEGTHFLQKPVSYEALTSKVWEVLVQN